MKWLPAGPMAYVREDGNYIVNRAPQEGWPAAYMLVDKRSGEIVDVERGVTKENHRAAWERLMEKCDA